MTGRERILTALKLKKPDRVPFLLWGVDPYGWMGKEPSYRRLVEYVLKHLEFKKQWQPKEGVELFYSGAKTEIKVRKRTEEGREIEEHLLRTPKGPLTSVVKSVPGTTVRVVVKHYIESEEEAERFLSLPYKLPNPEIASYFFWEKTIGERGVITHRVSEPMGMAVRIIKPEKLALWSLTHEDLVGKLLDNFFQRIFNYIERILRGGVKPIFIIGGSEHASLLGPHFFEKFVVKYDRILVDMIHHYGALVILHCHGKLKEFLDMIARIGPDGLHPLEEPPMGDITLEEAKQKIGDRICLVGNIQISDMYEANPDQIKQKCRRIIQAAAEGGGLIISPTATPYQLPLTDKTYRNYIQLIKTGKEIGRY